VRVSPSPSDALKPAGSQPVGAPSADPRSDAGFRASAAVAAAELAVRPAEEPVFDQGSAGGAEGEPKARERSSLRGSSRAGPSTEAPSGASSLVHTKDTTRPAGRRSAFGQQGAPTSEVREAESSLPIASRGEPREKSALWLARLERIGAETRPHRSAQARKLINKAIAATRAAIQDGCSAEQAREKGTWYRRRAAGHRERIKRVIACGAEVIEVFCPGCGQVHTWNIGCRIGSLCPWCRGSIAAKQRRRFLAARKAVVDAASAAGLLAVNRRGGAYSEKFVTLTAPHVPGDTVDSRIERVLEAWPYFIKALNRHMKGSGVTSHEFYRCVEWVPAQDDQAGHPHVHFWFFGPYLDRETQLVVWWRNALLLAGMPSTAPGPFVHVERVLGGRGGAQEIIKYLTKDIDHNGRPVPPVVLARVYEAFDGKRQRQSSQKLMKKAGGRQLCDCESELPRSVRVRRKEPEES